MTRVDLRKIPRARDFVSSLLRGLHHVREIDLRDTDVDDAALAIVAQMPLLRTVSVNGSRISSTGIGHFVRHESLAKIEGTLPELDSSVIAALAEPENNAIQRGVANRLVLADRASVRGDRNLEELLRSEARSLLDAPLDGRASRTALIRGQRWSEALSTFSPDRVHWEQLFCWYALGDYERYRAGRRMLLSEQTEFEVGSWSQEMILRASLLLPIDEDAGQRDVIRKLAALNDDPTVTQGWKRELVGQAMYRLGEFSQWWARTPPDSALRRGEYNQLFRCEVDYLEQPTRERLLALEEALFHVTNRNARMIDELGVVQKFWWDWIISSSYSRDVERRIERVGAR